MNRLGPFVPEPVLAVGVSGGADSLALCLLAHGWAVARGGRVLALIVDHGLRAEAAREAAVTSALLEGRGIAHRVLTLRHIAPGPRLAERARAARFAALERACAEAGIAELLLGHHAADQAETVIMRALSHSGPAGMAGMAAARAFGSIRVLRPLLGVAPAAVRDWLRAQRVAGVEDPSNEKLAALRPRLRALRADRAGDGFATRALVAAARVAGERRAAREREIAGWLAEHAELRPEGFAILPPGPLPADVLASLIRWVAGAAFPPPEDQVAALAAAPRAATLAGARLMRAGRLGRGLLEGGWLLLREAAAMAPAVPAEVGAVWDGRFRLAADIGADAELGGLGAASAGFRRRGGLPSAVLATLPALWREGRLLAVPHLDFPDAAARERMKLLPAMASPAVADPFVTMADMTLG